MPEINPLQARVDALETELAAFRKSDSEALRAQIVVLNGELAQARQDAAQARQDAADAAKKTAEVSQERLDALVAERLSVLDLAKTSDIKPEGTNLAIKRAIVVKRTPELAARVDSLSEETLDTLLAVYKAQPHPSLAAAVAFLAPPAERKDSATPAKTVSQIRDEAIAKNHSAWKKSHGVLGEDK
jgi:hypothetical protein